MHLNRLSLRNFKKYRRAEIEFQDGLTGIVGGNGAGKSTIVEAVAWALYGSKASTIKRDFIKNARAGENDSVSVVLSLRMGNQELSISRGMRGKSMSPEAALDIDGRRVASGSREVDGRLEEMLKISFQDFMKTFYARQKDLDNLLREGGTGKREYLLKLLGLDEIRERSVEQIKSDLRALDGQKNRIFGALAEIGEVERRMEDLARSVSSAQEELIRSRKMETGLAEVATRRRRELDLQAEKRRSHDLLSEKISGFETSALDKKRIIGAGEIRLREIDELKKLLAELEPKQKRLKIVKARIDLLEPRRKEHDTLIQRSIRIRTELAVLGQTIQDSEQRLLSLTKEQSELEDIEPLETEYQEVQAAYAKLETLRDRHMELRTCIDGERIRRDSTETNLARAETAKKHLLDAQFRIVQLQPLVDEHRALQEELVGLIRQKDMKKELDGLTSRRTVLQVHSQKLADEKAAMQVDLAALGDLEAKEAELRKQDSELDKLRTYLDSTREGLRGDIKVQESRMDDAKRNLSKVKGLGEEGSCPTCERPLGYQYLQLVEKYEIAALGAEMAIEDLKRDVQELTDKINSVISSRSNLKKSFDDLNSKKNRRAELIAGLRSLERQEGDAAFESAEISKAIVALGEVRHDPERLVAVQARLEEILPSIEGHKLLAFKLEDLPSREAELESLKAEILRSDRRLMDFGQEIEDLGYAESEYLDKKNVLTELKQSHDDFVLLSQRVLEIPVLEDRIRSRRADLEKLEHAVTVIRKSLEDLGFDPVEYESLLEEGKSLSLVEDDAHKINLKVAAEAEIRERLRETAVSLAELLSKLILGKEQLKALVYDESQHDAAIQGLEQAEEGLEAARKEASNRQVHLGVLEAEMARLHNDAERKKEFEKELAVLDRRLEVVDTTRSLVNRFLDHILGRIRSEIVRIAGEILEEVSGKYSLLKIDDDFNIMVEDEGEYYPISRYSGGEVDMIAVSVRVAISEYLMRFCRVGSGYSFLILDEVFGGQDLEHREKMIQMLRSLEERFPQIIAISHFSDVQWQFDNTINVVEDEMGNSRVEVV
jgi:DNA repair protein SbcC/Rad50